MLNYITQTRFTAMMIKRSIKIFLNILKTFQKLEFVYDTVINSCKNVFRKFPKAHILCNITKFNIQYQTVNHADLLTTYKRLTYNYLTFPTTILYLIFT